MQIVIEISEAIKDICDNDTFERATNYVSWFNGTLVMAIKNGIPLPKCHERLICSPTTEEIEKTIGGKNDFAECIRDAVKAVFDNAKTIIPADREDLGVCKYAPRGYVIDKCPFQKKGCKKQCVQAQVVPADEECD